MNQYSSDIKVSIIIVNYKTPQLCIDCIKSVAEKTKDISYEIIVVDNNSQDGSLQLLNEIFGDSITLIDAKDNLGFGKGNNLGAKYANGAALFLLNSDTLLKNNAIKILYDFLMSDKTIAIAGGNLTNASGKPMHSFKRDRIDFKTLCVNGFFKTLKNKLTGKISENEYNFSGCPMELDGYITGADLMIRKDIFDEVGGFDKDFFMYFEESEMTCRIHSLGYKVFSVPAAEIIHLEGASMGKGVSGKRLRMYNESAVKYFTKVYGSDSRLKCYKILIKNCNKSIIKRLATLNFDAVKAISAEKRILKEELKQISDI